MDPWYKKGVNFKCTACGKCCFGFPGYVWLNSKDIQNMSLFLKLSSEAFLKKYTRNIEDRISLIELGPPTFSCIFLKDKKCSVYEARPFQCRAYPFWPHNFTSEQTWEEVQKSCVGAKQDFHYSFEEIEKRLALYKKELPF